MKTNMTHHGLAVFYLCLLNFAFCPVSGAQHTAFTYQGQLNDAGNTANGLYDLRFSIYDVESSGMPVGVVTNEATEISGGLFTVTLDFGTGVFDGNERWLEIGATTNGGAAFTTLTPRQPITSTPYAMMATSVNMGSIVNPSFIGTTTANPLEFSVNSEHALRLEDSGGTPNLIGGYSGNSIDSGVEGSIIAGGGKAGQENVISANANVSAIGGGIKNAIGSGSYCSAIAGGVGNSIGENAFYSTISGGRYNAISDLSETATIAGGRDNDIGVNSQYGVIGGGRGNNIASNSFYATIPGGYLNAVGVNADFAFAAGRQAKANHEGTFVWADSENVNFASTADNQFLIRASGGVGIGTTSPLAQLHVSGNASFGSAFTPVATNARNIINLQVGAQTDGTLNGISFCETGNSAGMKLGYDGSGAGAKNKLVIYDLQNSPQFVFENGGNLGIGTTNPKTSLDIEAGPVDVELGRVRYSEDHSGMTLRSSDALPGWERNAYLAYDGEALSLVAKRVMLATQPPSFNSGITIQNDGDVGIGIANPMAALHVMGETLVVGEADTGRLRIGNSVTNNGYAQIWMGENQGGSGGVVMEYDGPQNRLEIYRSGHSGTNLFTLNRDSGNMHVNGDILITGVDTGSLRIGQTTVNGKAQIYMGEAPNGEGGMVLEYDGQSNDLKIYWPSHPETELLTLNRNSGNMHVAGTVSCEVLEIRGADLAENYPVEAATSMDPEPGMVVSIDPNRSGGMMVSDRPYDRRVAGVISGAGDIHHGMLMGNDPGRDAASHPIALTGRVYCHAVCANGIIEPGDLLTTSTRAGYAMKATDYDRSRGAVIGKAMSRLEEGAGLVLVLVQPQ